MNFVSCNECGWCKSDGSRGVPLTALYTCTYPIDRPCEPGYAEVFFDKKDIDFITKARRCRSFATPEQVEETKRIERRGW